MENIGPDGIGSGVLIAPDIRMNIYTKTHSYGGPGRFTVSVTDPNRNAGILNVNFPNSDQVAFYIQTEVPMESSTINDSPVILMPPIDQAFIGQPFFHALNAFDLDGDSLAYRLIASMQSVDTDVPNYQFPNMINASPNNSISIDEITGLLTWDSPQLEGEYNVAIQIESYRNGSLLDVVIRDMQITVLQTVNALPNINVDVLATDIIEVEPGTSVLVNVSASDPDPGQVVTLSTTSGLYDNFETTADFTLITSGETPSGVYEWEVKEEHLREQAYQVVFKAQDDLEAARFQIVRFRVVENITNTLEPERQLDLKLYPNPATTILQVELDQLPEVADYSVLNTSGQQVLSGQLGDLRTETISEHFASRRLLLSSW